MAGGKRSHRHPPMIGADAVDPAWHCAASCKRVVPRYEGRGGFRGDETTWFCPSHGPSPCPFSSSRSISPRSPATSAGAASGARRHEDGRSVPVRVRVPGAPRLDLAPVRRRRRVRLPEHAGHLGRRGALRGLLRQLALRPRGDDGGRNRDVAAGGGRRRRRRGGAGRRDADGPARLHRAAHDGRVPGRPVPRRPRAQRPAPARRPGRRGTRGVLARRAPGADRAVRARPVPHRVRRHLAPQRVLRHGGPVLAGVSERAPAGGLPRERRPLIHGHRRRVPPPVLPGRGLAAGPGRDALHHRGPGPRVDAGGAEHAAAPPGGDRALEPAPVARHRPRGARGHRRPVPLRSPLGAGPLVETRAEGTGPRPADAVGRRLPCPGERPRRRRTGSTDVRRRHTDAPDARHRVGLVPSGRDGPGRARAGGLPPGPRVRHGRPGDGRRGRPASPHRGARAQRADGVTDGRDEPLGDPPALPDLRGGRDRLAGARRRAGRDGRRGARARGGPADRLGPRAGSRPRALDGAPRGGRDVGPDVPGLPDLRRRSVPGTPVRAPASRVPPVRRARPRRPRRGEPEGRRSPGGGGGVRVHRRPPPVRSRERPVHLRIGAGVVLHGAPRLRRVPGPVGLVQGVLGGVGRAPGRGGEAALGARPRRGPEGAAPSGTPPVHPSHHLDGGGSRGARPPPGRVHPLQHRRAEHVVLRR